ncbi:MAG TPA: allophanate hydrolase [Steroidobacteraceae bacterium]|jgi:allophanate hydrolase|nr:allophanate hydrolase [Steroidobacteraceae bacterium]
MSCTSSLQISELLAGYRARRFSPVEIVEQLLGARAARPERCEWIDFLPAERVRRQARALAAIAPDALPLYGIPFAIKDNIDLEGVPTTAGCRAYAYTPAVSAPVVERLLAAGAIPIGKTTLDQFATGLTGTRSPWGACRNSFDARYVSGGSSSGSAVAVATGQVSFALGTDTAGSVRLPAAFNDLIGLKPSCGSLSTRGVVPACRSLDCVGVLALVAADAARVLAVTRGFDPQDPYSRSAPPAPPTIAREFRFGVPDERQLEFFGDREYQRLFGAACARLESLGGTAVRIDLAPWQAAGELLYGGAWLAERYGAVGKFIESRPAEVLPVIRTLISPGRLIPATEAFLGQYRLLELKRTTGDQWRAMDVLLTPTAGTIYPIDAVEADPIALNDNLGRYARFTNLLDLTTVAVPAGFRIDGLPFGVSLTASAWSDDALLALAARFQAAGPTAARRAP